MSVYPISSPPSPQAVMDTSFWSLCCYCGLEPYLWKVWARPIWVPTVVKNQIFYHAGDYPDQQAFQQAEHEGLLAIRDPQIRITQFRSGEREVLSLAQEVSATALIDDFSAHRYAGTILGLDTVGVLEFLVSLLEAEIITLAQAESAYHQLVQLRATNQGWLKWAYNQIKQRGGNP